MGEQFHIVSNEIWCLETLEIININRKLKAETKLVSHMQHVFLGWRPAGVSSYIQPQKRVKSTMAGHL